MGSVVHDICTPAGRRIFTPEAEGRSGFHEGGLCASLRALR